MLTAEAIRAILEGMRLLLAFVALGSACSGTVGADRDASSGVDGATDKICDPGLAPVWGLEGDPVSFLVGCRTGYDLEDRQLVLRNPPAGAQYDDATREFLWTPGLDQAAVYELEFEVPQLDGETGVTTVGIADRWNDPANVPIVDLTRYPMEYGLPVLFIDQPPSDKEWQPVTVHYRGEALVGEAKLRGKSSLNYPKRSYAFRFDGGNALTESEIADFAGKRRLVATSTFDDNSYLRQRLCYWLWKQLEPTIQIEAYSAVLYLGGEYHGLYTISDQPTARLMQESGLADSGNLYKAETHDANFRTTNHDDQPKATLHDGYSKTEGTPEEGEAGAFADLDALVDLVANSDDDTFNGGIEAQIEASEYIDWFVLVLFTLAKDSGGKNSYHYHDAVRTWRVAPWDFNESFGQSWQTFRFAASDSFEFQGYNLLFTRLRNHPTLGPALSARFAELLAPGGAFSAGVLDVKMQEWVAETSASARRDWAKWEAAYRSYGGWSSRTDIGSYDDEVGYVQTWIGDRRAYLDSIY